MFPLRSILCPIDFSETSREALRWATALARHDGAGVRVASVIEPAVTEAGAVAFDVETLHVQTRQSLRAFAADSAPPAARWWREPSIDICVGVPWVEIIGAAERAGADLIVMGTHGFSGVRKAVFGSTTERVLRRTAIPVLAVPPGSPVVVDLSGDDPAFRFGRVVAPVDFGPGTDRQADTAARIARTFGVPLVVLHVVPEIREHALLAPHRDTRDRLRRAQAAHALETIASRLASVLSVETILRTGQPAEEIALLVSERQAGLVVMGLHGGTGLFAARPGSIAYRVMCQSHVPVLALPPHVPVRSEQSEMHPATALT